MVLDTSSHKAVRWHTRNEFGSIRDVLSYSNQHQILLSNTSHEVFALDYDLNIITKIPYNENISRLYQYKNYAYIASDLSLWNKIDRYDGQSINELTLPFSSGVMDIAGDDTFLYALSANGTLTQV